MHQQYIVVLCICLYETEVVLLKSVCLSWSVHHMHPFLNISCYYDNTPGKKRMPLQLFTLTANWVQKGKKIFLFQPFAIVSVYHVMALSFTSSKINWKVPPQTTGIPTLSYRNGQCMHYYCVDYTLITSPMDRNTMYHRSHTLTTSQKTLYRNWNWETKMVSMVPIVLSESDRKHLHPPSWLCHQCPTLTILTSQQTVCMLSCQVDFCPFTQEMRWHLAYWSYSVPLLRKQKTVTHVPVSASGGSSSSAAQPSPQVCLKLCWKGDMTPLPHNAPLWWHFAHTVHLFGDTLPTQCISFMTCCLHNEYLSWHTMHFFHDTDTQPQNCSAHLWLSQFSQHCWYQHNLRTAQRVQFFPSLYATVGQLYSACPSLSKYEWHCWSALLSMSKSFKVWATLLVISTFIQETCSVGKHVYYNHLLKIASTCSRVMN